MSVAHTLIASSKAVKISDACVPSTVSCKSNLNISVWIVLPSNMLVLECLRSRKTLTCGTSHRRHRSKGIRRTSVRETYLSVRFVRA